MTEERYDLKDSKRSVRELYPVLKDAHGNVIDGFHRLEADPDWRTETLEHIKTPVQLILARIVANTHRRVVSQEERSEQIAELAEVLENEDVPASEIISTIQGLLGFSRRHILRLAPEKYKRAYVYGSDGTIQSDIMSHSLENSEASPDDEELSAEERESLKEALEEARTKPAVKLKESFPENEAQAWLADTLDRFPGADEDWLLQTLRIKFHLSGKEALNCYKNWKGESILKVEHIREAERIESDERGEKPKKVPKYTPPPGTPTCRCPMCRRDGADKSLILLNFVENPSMAQKTLFNFVTEAFKR